MTARNDLAKLTAITKLVLDDNLQRLRQANDARERSLMQLAALSAPAPNTDLPAVAADKVALNYQRWADLRRADLNAVLARQTVAVMEANAAASLAFGRAQAVRGIADKLASQQKRQP